MDILCPNCGHHKTKRAALVYGSGTTEHRFSAFAASLSLPQMLAAFTLLAGLWWVILPAMFIGGGITAFAGRGRSATLIASANKPPRKIPSWLIYLGGATTALFLPLIVVGLFEIPLNAGVWYVVIMALSAILSVTLARAMLKYNNTTWGEHEAIWQRTFMCNRCGTRFIKSEFDPVGVNVVRSDGGHGNLLPDRFEENEVAVARGKARTDDKDLRKRKSSR